MIIPAGEFVRDHEAWRWWVTLTFARSATRYHAVWAMQRWLREIARKMIGAHVHFAWCVETHVNGGSHVHLLLAFEANADRFSAPSARALWSGASKSSGFVSIAAYDPENAAAFYLVKDGDWCIDVVCSRPPRCRRSNRRGASRGCAVSRLAW